MDYNIMLSSLEGKLSEFEVLQAGAKTLHEEGKSDLSSMNGTEISSLYEAISSSMERLENGYTKCQSWLSEYTMDLNKLEKSLASFNCSTIETPTEFKGEFIDLFGKKVIPTLKKDGDANLNLDLGMKGLSGLSQDELKKVLEAAESQLGVPYHSLHYGPKGSSDEGFGCAMFVSYCYNQALFNGARGDDDNTEGFIGSTYEYWGNVTNDGYNAHNKGFVEVSADEAQPGDVVCYITEGTDPYATIENCPHVALYVGDGQIIGSGVYGVEYGDVSSQSYGTVPHYLHYVGNKAEDNNE